MVCLDKQCGENVPINIEYFLPKPVYDSKSIRIVNTIILQGKITFSSESNDTTSELASVLYIIRYSFLK